MIYEGIVTDWCIWPLNATSNVFLVSQSKIIIVQKADFWGGKNNTWIKEWEQLKIHWTTQR